LLKTNGEHARSTDLTFYSFKKYPSRNTILLSNFPCRCKAYDLDKIDLKENHTLTEIEIKAKAILGKTQNFQYQALWATADGSKSSGSRDPGASNHTDCTVKSR
jgi:hypothetical protein